MRRRCQFRWPANRRWSCGKPTRRVNGSCQTGQFSRSASATTASQSSKSGAPTTSAGASAPSRRSASSSTCEASTECGRSKRAGEPAASSSAGSSQSPIGATTRAGPRAALASCQARAIAPGRSWGRLGSWRHTGYSPASRSSARPVRNGSKAIWRRSCWPTRMTSGARQSRAFAIALIALPRPAAVCRLTNAGAPRASAYPDAIPTTEPSCSPRTNRRSLGRSVRNEISVEPGLPKIVVRPCRRITSNAASRTVRPATICPLPLPCRAAGSAPVVWLIG